MEKVFSSSCWVFNGTARFKKCKQSFRHQHLLLLGIFLAFGSGLATVLATFYTIVLIYFDNLVALGEDTEVVGAGNEEH